MKINWGLVLTIVGSLITGIGTYIQTNEGIKSQVKDQLEEKNEEEQQ